MTTRLAALLAAFATTACVTEGADSLDELPIYDQDTGGGKFDDANCTDETYRTFIRGYMAGTEEATANPCVSGNDASYRIWAYLAGDTLKPMLAAYQDAKSKRFNGNASKADVIAAGTLSETAKASLAKLEAIRPANAGRVGVAAWLEYLYTPAFTAATPIVGGDQAALLTEGLDQHPFEITAFEEEWLGFAERNQPTATEGHAFTLWWNATKPTVDDLSNPFASTSEAEASTRATFLERLAATRPAGAFDEDQTTFQTEVTTKIAAEYNVLGDTAKYAASIALKPAGGGAVSYKTWAVAFAGIAQRYTAAANDKQKAIFQQVIDLRPCASGPDVDTLVTRLAVLTAVGPDGVTPMATSAVPTACAE